MLLFNQLHTLSVHPRNLDLIFFFDLFDLALVGPDILSATYFKSNSMIGGKELHKKTKIMTEFT